MASTALGLNMVVAIYQGFVHTDMDDDTEPGYEEVKHVVGMFTKYSLKAIQKEHPLFARGSSEKLNFSAAGDMLKAEGKKGILFETNITKMVYVAPVKKNLYIIVKRSPAPKRFSCHIFKMASEKAAADFSSSLWSLMKTAARCGRLSVSAADLMRPASASPAMRTRAVSEMALSASLSSLPKASNSSAVSEEDEEEEGYESGKPSSSAGPAQQPDLRPKRQSYEMFSPRGPAASRSPGGGASTPDMRGRLMTMDLRVPNAASRASSHNNWLHEGLLRKDAEELVQGRPVGTFVVRRADGSSAITMVLRDGSLSHFKILTAGSEVFVMGDEEIRFASLDSLVSFYYTHQITKHGDHFVAPV